MKNCKECDKEFIQYNSIQKLCFDCTLKKAKVVVTKKHNNEWKQRKAKLREKVKTISDYRKDARYWFQRWIRIRDLGKSCISCNKLLTDIRDYHAGHMVQANNYPQLLFNEYAVNGQCIFCNNYKAGNEIEYRKGIVKRYGQDILIQLNEIADNKNKPILTKEYYLNVTHDYKNRCNKIEKID